MNNNNNKHYLIYIYIFLFINGDNHHYLNTLLTFNAKENFFISLQEACGEKNINLAICIKNFNNKIYNIQGNFHNLSLKSILDICIDKDLFHIYIKNNFLILKEKVPITKIYYIDSYLNPIQKKSLFDFLKSFSERMECKITYSEEDSYIVINTLEKNHIIIDNYINNINKKYNKQICLECKIISIENKNEHNKNLNLMEFFKNILSFKLNYINIFNSLQGILLFNKIDNVIRFLSQIFIVKNIHNLDVLILNQQPCEFKTEEIRYTSNYYDTQYINNNIDDNIVKKNNNKFQLNLNNNSSHVIKNLKYLTSGINLKIIPYIKDEEAILNIQYEQSIFQENSNNKELPNIVKNNFNSYIKIELNKIILINGLKNYYQLKIIKNKSQWRILNFLFGEEVIINKESQIIFLIKVVIK